MKYRCFALVALLAVPLVSAQSQVWAQCGGMGWSGATTCVSGSVCTKLNDWYFQCIPGSNSQPPPPSTPTTTVQPPATTSTTPTTPTAPASITGFVKTSGQKFVLNGQTYTVAGTNAYWLAQVSNADIDKAFSDIAAAGLTTVRTWGFNDVTSRQNFGAFYQLWQNGQATFNTGDFGISRFDYVVQSAKAHGIRLIVPLTNNWSDYGGMDVYVSQLGGSTHDAFYTNQRIISAFQNYIKTFVGRYVNEPTIMAWELANEPRCKGSSSSASASCSAATITQWATTMSAYIKSIDPNHLVAIGDEGFFQGQSGGYPYNANEGVDFSANIKIASIDFGTFHSYPESWGESANPQQWGVGWIQAHADVQKSANKPVIIEEFGVTNNQATVYSAWLDAIMSSGLTGFNIWQAGSQLSTGNSPNDGYAVYPNSAVYTLLENAVTQLKARG